MTDGAEAPLLGRRPLLLAYAMALVGVSGSALQGELPSGDSLLAASVKTEVAHWDLASWSNEEYGMVPELPLVWGRACGLGAPWV